MKFIKNKKTYNTETSSLIHEWWNGKGRDDFSCVERDLYRRPDGEYWVRVFGGAATTYAVTGRGFSREWEGALPLSDKEAYEYLEGLQEYALLESYFPHMLDPEKDPPLSIADLNTAMRILLADLTQPINSLPISEEEIVGLLDEYESFKENGGDAILFLKKIPADMAEQILLTIK